MRILMVSLVLLVNSLSVFSAEVNSEQPTSIGNELVIILPNDVQRDYDTFIGDKDPLTMTDYSGIGSRRDVVEVVLLQQALALGGISDKIRFVVTATHARIIKQVHSGKAVMAGNSIWQGLLEDKDLLYVSEPIIENGEFEAGLYTVANNKKILAAKDINDIRKFTAVSSNAWIVDWQTLNALKVNSLINTVKWTSMVGMVEKGRADFLLAPFHPSADLSFVAEGVRLVAVPGLKIGLQGSRHFAVSKRNPDGKRIIEGLNKGIIELKKKGLIEKAYSDSGFFNQQVEEWIKII